MQTTIFDTSRKVIGELRQERTSDSAVLLAGVKALEVFGRDYCTVCMDKVARLLNDMVEAGIINGLRGLWCRGQMRYTEAVLMLDACILVAVP
jgi:hypothetical protein